MNIIAMKCKQVEALDIMVLLNNMIELVVKAMPNLCRLFVRLGSYHSLTPGRIHLLAALPRLHTITLCDERDIWDYISQAEVETRFQPLIQAATDALKKHDGDENGKKWVRVRHRTRYRNGGAEMLWTKDVEVEP